MTLKKLLSFALLLIGCVLHSHAQVACPPNLDFELGTYANWHYYKDAGGGTGCCPISTPTYCGYGIPCTSPTIRHQLMTGAGTDPCCSFPVVPPGAGTYTLKLGNSSTNYEAEKLRYYINVPVGSTTYSLFYRYAIVLQDATHTAIDQPRFEVKAYDSATNAPLPCAQYSYVTSASLPGFFSVTTAPCGTSSTPIRCKAWTTQSLNLSGMAGKTIAVDFATGDCGAGGHFGYAYVDLSCGVFGITVSACNGAPISLSAPAGFAFYYWYDSSTFATVLGSTQTVVLAAPSDTTTYACVIQPYAGFGCADTVYTRVFPSDLYIHPSNDTVICPGASVRLTDSATDIVGPITHTWTPATGLTCTTCDVVWATPPVTTTYTVTATNPAGCTKTDTIRVDVVNIGVSSVTVTNPTICGMNDGTATLWGLPPLQADTVTYTDMLGTHTVSGVVAADGSVVLTGLVGYSSSGAGATYTFYVKAGFCTTTATAYIIDPAPIMPSFDTMVALGCEGDTVRCINTTLPAGYFSFWTFSDYPSAVDAATNPVHIFHTEDNTPKYTGSYTIKLAYNTTPSRMPHCEAFTTMGFTSDHHIQASFYPHTDTTCLGTPFSFYNTSTSHFNATYLWTYQGGVDVATDSLTVVPEYTYPVGGIYTPTLTMTDELGCVDDTSMRVEVVSINVKAGFGALSYSLPNADTSVCLYNNGLASAPDSIHLRAYDSVVYSQKTIGNPAYHVDWLWIPSGSNPTTGGLGSFNTQFPTFAGLGDFVFSVVATTHTYSCVTTEEVLVHSHPPVVLTDLTPSGQIVPLGSTIQLNAGGAVYYWWTPDDGTLNDPNINNPVATPHDSATIYTVHGMSLFGCPAQADILVYVDNSTDEFVPSAFTPNGDGLNDVFRPMQLRFQKLVDFRVFNRWGEQLFQTITPGAGWDGAYKGVPQDMGTYHYTATIQRPDGKDKVMKGTVNLIR